MRSAARPGTVIAWSIAIATTGPVHQRAPGHEVNRRSIVRRDGKITRIRYEEVSTVEGNPGLSVALFHACHM